MGNVSQTQLQGQFISNGKTTTIKLASGVDWLEIYNITNITANNVAVATPTQWYWQFGMPAGAGIYYLKTDTAANSVNLVQYTTTNGFTFVNGGTAQYGIPVAINTTTNAAQPVYLTGTTTGISVGSIVRIYGTNEPSVNGYDVEVGAFTAATSFTSAASFSTNPAGGPAASVGGFYQIINPLDPWYPASRTIINITQAASAVVTTSVQHNYTVGQSVSFRLSDATFGMTQINGLSGTITATTEFTFTVNINSTAFSAFAWPSWMGAVTYPQVLPVGEDTSVALAQVPPLYTFSDATLNTAYIGIQFPGGAAAATAGPAGINNDVIYWRAGVSFSNDATGSLIIH